MITKIHAYLLKEVNLAENAEEKTVKGGKPAFRKENKSLISPDSGIRRGLGSGTDSVLYKILASLSCPELNLINI